MDSIVDETYAVGLKLAVFDLTGISANFGKLLLDSNNLLIQFADQAIACQDGVKIKQFSTRTSQLSGLFNWMFTVGYGVGYDYAHNALPSFLPALTQQPLNVASLNIVNPLIAYFSLGTLINCQEFGFNLGLFISESLEAKVDTSVAFIEVAKFA